MLYLSADGRSELVKCNNACYTCLQMLDESSLSVLMRIIDVCRCYIRAS